MLPTGSINFRSLRLTKYTKTRHVNSVLLEKSTGYIIGYIILSKKVRKIEYAVSEWQIEYILSDYSC